MLKGVITSFAVLLIDQLKVKFVKTFILSKFHPVSLVVNNVCITPAGDVT